MPTQNDTCCEQPKEAYNKESSSPGTCSEREFSEEECCHVKENKTYRMELDKILQTIKTSTRKSRERSILITKMQEAIMWAGMDLKALNDGRTIYPDSYDPSNTYVAPTADGLKM